MVVLIDTSIAREQIMLRLLGRGSQLCDKITRRGMLQAGAISALGLNLSALLRASDNTARDCLWILEAPETRRCCQHIDESSV